MRKILVVGGGAAGLMAAAIAAKGGAAVTLFEKNKLAGLKMGITGKGRCNITNACDMADFIAKTPGNGKFLYGAYERFTNEDLLDLLHSWGLKTKVERGGRVFPASDSAIEVRNLFTRAVKEAGGTIRYEEPVKSLIVEDGRCLGVKTDQGLYYGDAVIVCTGGASYPTTGSTGDGYKMAEAVGHKVTAIRPSLVPIEVAEDDVKELMGLSLKNVSLQVEAKGKVVDKQFGEMLFTHFGLTGPMILSASHAISKYEKKKASPIYVDINLKPALSAEALDKRVQRDFQQHSNKQLVNGLKDLLPQRLIPYVIKRAGLTEDKVVHQITKEERQALVQCLQGLRFTFTRTRPIAEAIVTAGGVTVKEVNPKTMASKVVADLYWAGEVLDIDAYTGGYNLQAAFSTAYVAAKAALAGETN